MVLLTNSRFANSFLPALRTGRTRGLFLISMALSLAIEVRAENWRPDDRFLNAIRFVESSNGRFLVGDGGRSLGDFQMSAAAWKDVSALRKRQGLRTYEYRAYVMNPTINRIYAADYLVLLRGQLKKKLKRVPSPGEIYAAYNMGLTGFGRCNYQLARVNRGTARNAELISRALREESVSFEAQVQLMDRSRL